MLGKFLDFKSKFSSLGRDKRDFHGNFAESMFTVEKLKYSKWHSHDEDIYAVNDDDESNNEDVPMVTELVLIHKRHPFWPMYQYPVKKR